MAGKGKDVIVLYFGDADDKGRQIPESAITDIRAWSDTPFKLVHGGLTRSQAIRLRLPQDPENPGKWQWDALSDEQAGGIILTTLRQTIGSSDYQRRLWHAVKTSQRKTKRWVNRARRALEDVDA
jgi:hypothetical protein